MSSLKGQLSNVEGSVKSMKMAVVVGSVLTVACLAAVFGVTILANEVSKETKVSNGALVNRQGSNVATASMTYADVREALLSKKMTVGDIIHLPIGSGSDYLATLIEEVKYVANGQIVMAKTKYELIIVDANAEGLQVVMDEKSSLHTTEEGSKAIPQSEWATMTQERKTQFWWCGAIGAAIELANNVITAYGMVTSWGAEEWLAWGVSTLMDVFSGISSACFSMFMGGIKLAVSIIEAL